MKIINRSALHDYTVLDRFEAGIKLTGPEVKSVKGNRVTLKGAFVKVMGSEVYLVNAQIQPYIFARIVGYDPQRTRKLLLSKSQIISLKTKLDSEKLALIPISLYTHHGLVKVEIGLARGKKQFEKRETIKRREEKRELGRVFRAKIKI